MTIRIQAAKRLLHSATAEDIGKVVSMLVTIFGNCNRSGDAKETLVFEKQGVGSATIHIDHTKRVIGLHGELLILCPSTYEEHGVKYLELDFGGSVKPAAREISEAAHDAMSQCATDLAGMRSRLKSLQATRQDNVLHKRSYEKAIAGLNHDIKAAEVIHSALEKLSTGKTS